MKITAIITSMLLCFSSLTLAEVQVNKDWAWDLSGEEYVYAATLNTDQRILGQYCYFSDSTCVYLVSLGITCESGSDYPSILNSSAGVAEVRLVCAHKYNGENVFFIKPFDDVDNLIKQANNVGFAVAMEEGEFKVVRFSLSGSTYAIEMMRAGAEIINGKKTNSQKKVKSEEYL